MNTTLAASAAASHGALAPGPGHGQPVEAQGRARISAT
jgi:hypothetical protein